MESLQGRIQAVLGDLAREVMMMVLTGEIRAGESKAKAEEALRPVVDRHTENVVSAVQPFLAPPPENEQPQRGEKPEAPQANEPPVVVGQEEAESAVQVASGETPPETMKKRVTKK